MKSRRQRISAVNCSDRTGKLSIASSLDSADYDRFNDYCRRMDMLKADFIREAVLAKLAKALLADAAIG